MRRFVRDDPGYLEWLTSHPAGFVLNTYAHATPDYLILHRSSCRTINRQLRPGSMWTSPYAKTCSDVRGEIEEWAIRETGKQVRPHSQCAGTGGVRSLVSPVPRTPGGLGSRAPRLLDRPVAFTGDPIRIIVTRPGNAPRLVIEGAQWLAETFFRRDPSAVGTTSYDAWIDLTQSDAARRDRVLDLDVVAVNTTMAARSSHASWASVVASGDWSWLERIDPSWT